MRARCVGLEPEAGDLTYNHISLGFLNNKLLPSKEPRSRSRSRSTTFASRSKSRSKRDLLRADQGCGKESCLGNGNLEISCGKMQGKNNSNSMLGCGKEQKISKCSKNCGKAGTGCEVEEKGEASESLSEEAFGLSRKKHHNCQEEPEERARKPDEKCYQETHSTDQCSATIENKETTTRHKTKNVVKSREHETSKKVDTSESHQHCSSAFFTDQNDKDCKNGNKVSAFTTWPDQVTTTRDHFSNAENHFSTSAEDHFMTTEDHYSACTVEDHQESSFAKMLDIRLPSNLPMTRITCTTCHHDKVSLDQKKEKAWNNNKHDCVIGNMEKISEEVRRNYNRFEHHFCIFQLHRTFAYMQ